MVNYDKLSSTQRRAYEKLAGTGKVFPVAEWYCAYSLGESLSTMRSLVRMGLAISRGADQPGAMSFPRTQIEFRIKE